MNRLRFETVEVYSVVHNGCLVGMYAVDDYFIEGDEPIKNWLARNVNQYNIDNKIWDTEIPVDSFFREAWVMYPPHTWENVPDDERLTYQEARLIMNRGWVRLKGDTHE